MMDFSYILELFYSLLLLLK